MRGECYAADQAVPDVVLVEHRNDLGEEAHRHYPSATAEGTRP
jgi:hypothetical protein